MLARIAEENPVVTQYWLDLSMRGLSLGYSPCLFIGSSLTDDYAVDQLSDAHRRRPGWFNYAVLLKQEREQRSSERKRRNQGVPKREEIRYRLDT